MSAIAASASRTERSKYLFVVLIGLAVVVLDQLTKLWVAASMRLHDSIPVIEGVFSLTYVRNTGAAFSMLADQPEALRRPFFAVVSLIAAGAIGYFVRQTPATQRWVLFACALVIGGAVGNLIDRLLYGYVIDFLDVYWRGWHWPAFNVADSCISVGVAILLLQAFLVRD